MKGPRIPPTTLPPTAFGWASESTVLEANVDCGKAVEEVDNKIVTGCLVFVSEEAAVD